MEKRFLKHFFWSRRRMEKKLLQHLSWLLKHLLWRQHMKPSWLQCVILPFARAARKVMEKRLLEPRRLRRTRRPLEPGASDARTLILKMANQLLLPCWKVFCRLHCRLHAQACRVPTRASGGGHSVSGADQSKWGSGGTVRHSTLHKVRLANRAFDGHHEDQSYSECAC